MRAGFDRKQWDGSVAGLNAARFTLFRFPGQYHNIATLHQKA